jgi:hypothetical protein
VDICELLEGAFDAGAKQARDVVAPKMTEKVAVDFAARSIAMADCGQWANLQEGDERDVTRGVTCKLYYQISSQSSPPRRRRAFKEEA